MARYLGVDDAAGLGVVVSDSIAKCVKHTHTHTRLGDDQSVSHTVGITQQTCYSVQCLVTQSLPLRLPVPHSIPPLLSLALPVIDSLPH